LDYSLPNTDIGGVLSADIMDCRVAVEAAVPVYNVDSTDEAIRIAISKTGEMLNPDLNYVEIEVSPRACPQCDGAVEPAFVAADEGLVALKLEMTAFNVEDEQHATRITRTEIGQRLDEIPLELLTVTKVPEDSEATGGEDSSVAADSTTIEPAETNLPAETDAEVLPEFEELIEDE
jgi:uncharacterized protein (UPF0212 family)